MAEPTPSPEDDREERRAMREILRKNAEVALHHALAFGDPERIALVRAWFAAFEAEA